MPYEKILNNQKKTQFREEERGMHENKKQMKKQKSENANKKEKEIPSVAHDLRCRRGKKTFATPRFVAYALT